MKMSRTGYDLDDSRIIQDIIQRNKARLIEQARLERRASWRWWLKDLHQYVIGFLIGGLLANRRNMALEIIGLVLLAMLTFYVEWKKK